MIKYLMFITSFLMGCDALYANPQVDWKRAVFIDKDIDDRVLPLGDKLLEYSANGKDPVHIIIDSPGGDTVNGFWFVDVMREVKSRGVTIKCYVPRLAASMAFQILLHCDERYALQQSVMLWHRVRGFFFQFIATGPTLADLAEDINKWDRQIIGDLKEHLPINEELMMHHLEKETLHIAYQLVDMVPRGWLRVYDTIPNLLSVPPEVPHIEDKNPFAMLFGGKTATPGSYNNTYRIRYQYVPVSGGK